MTMIRSSSSSNVLIVKLETRHVGEGLMGINCVSSDDDDDISIWFFGDEKFFAY